MAVIFIGLDKVQETMYQVANVLNSAGIQDVLWQMGEETRRQCQLMCTQVVYNTPESPRYRRTGYLRAAMYITTKSRHDRHEVQARAYALAVAMYPGRNTSKTYRMVPFQPYTANRAVRIVSGAIYSDFVEYGGSVGPRPFMRAGAEVGEREIIAVGERGLSKILSALSKGQPRDSSGRFIKRPR